MHHRIARVAVVVGLGIATLAYGALEKRVTVRIDGRPTGVRTFAGTVGDALARTGVRVGARDRVVPSVSEPIPADGTVNVYRAKRITLLLDGKPRHVVVTGLTIDEVLDEIAIRQNMADLVRPSRSSRVRPGMVINYRRAAAVAVVYDGKTERVVTNAATIGAVVRELGIKLGARDKLRPSARTHPASGMVVKVLRVGLRNEVREIRLPYRTILHRNRHLEYGRRRVAREGREGLKRVRYVAKYVDGVRVATRILAVVTVRHAVDRRIDIGAGFPGCACDRGSQSGKATWYSEADGLSAAHRTLPMGTVVRVENLSNHKWVNVVIRDRGPYGQGRIIDLSDEAFRRIGSLRSGIVRVRIRW